MDDEYTLSLGTDGRIHIATRGLSPLGAARLARELLAMPDVHRAENDAMHRATLAEIDPGNAPPKR